MSQMISSKLGQLLDRSLFAINEVSGSARAQAALDHVVQYVGTLRNQARNTTVDEVSFELGGAELLQALLVRVIERREGNRGLTFVRRRKYVRDMLHMLARSQEPVSPSAIATGLGAKQSAVAALLKEAEGLGLVSSVADVVDGRGRPRVLTDAGRTALTAVKPDWPIVAIRAIAESSAPGRASVMQNVSRREYFVTLYESDYPMMGSKSSAESTPILKVFRNPSEKYEKSIFHLERNLNRKASAHAAA